MELNRLIQKFNGNANILGSAFLQNKVGRLFSLEININYLL